MGGFWSSREFVKCDRFIEYNKKYAVFILNWDVNKVYHCLCGWKSFGREWSCCSDYWTTKISGIAVKCPKCDKSFAYEQVEKKSKQGLTKPKKCGRLRK